MFKIQKTIYTILLLNSSLLSSEEQPQLLVGGDTRTLITPSFYTGVISFSDLDQAAASDGAMYTINAPGRYYVSGDLNLGPSNVRVPAIKINADNVLLDLNSTTMYQRSGNSVASLRGIEIASGKSNITVRNGSINSLTGNGILVNDNCTNIALENLAVRGCCSSFDGSDTGRGGIVFDGGSGTEIKCCNIKNTYISQCNSSAVEVIGAQFNYCHELKVEDSYFNDNKSTGNDNDGSGVQLLDCKDCKFINCSANGNQGNGTGAAYGFNIGTSNSSSCFACNFKSCTASNNVGAPAYGFYIDESAYNTFDDCKAFYQQANSTSNAYGFYSTRTALAGVGNAFKNCHSSGNTGGSDSTSIGAGFAVAGSEKYSSIIDCYAEANDGGTGDGYGISIANGVTACQLKNNRLIANTGSNSGYGIRDQNTVNPDYSDNLYVQNMAYGNGKNDGTVVNNYEVKPKPTGVLADFPSKIGYFSTFVDLDGAVSGEYNIEIIEQQS